jgi:hypothetical protein
MDQITPSIYSTKIIYLGKAYFVPATLAHLVAKLTYLPIDEASNSNLFQNNASLQSLQVIHTYK